MAKETKQPKAAPAAAAPETQSASAAKPDKAARESAAKGDKFVFVKKTDAKMAPQAQCILNAIESAGTITRDELSKKLTGVLVTRQPVGRIVTYYQKFLEGTGAIKLEKAAVAAAPAAPVAKAA